ncbi:hypothetical protein BD779DRAFT_1671053 [Infundibulicybe gibba]|nr:hypothetical protein BD779DRAFT_1671053 [Infundibulicybe gibba]
MSAILPPSLIDFSIHPLPPLLTSALSATPSPSLGRSRLHRMRLGNPRNVTSSAPSCGQGYHSSHRPLCPDPPRNRELPSSGSVSPSPIRSSPNPGIIVISPLDGSHSPSPTFQQESQESVRGWERAWTHDWDHKPPSPSVLLHLSPNPPLALFLP